MDNNNIGNHSPDREPPPGSTADQHFITLGGRRIYEPMTAFTDLLLTLLALYFARKLWQQARIEHAQTKRAWGWGFIGSGVAAFAGGIVHGFGPYLLPWMRAALWKLTMCSTGFASLFMLVGTVYASAERATRPIWLGVVVVKSLVYAFYVARRNDFRYVVYDYASAMLAILIAQLREYKSRPAARQIAHGIGISFLAAAIQQVGVNLHTHFNKNDLYHVVQAAGFWLFYRGARKLEDQ